MQATAGKKEWPDRELMALPRDGRKRELLGGELLVSPTGFQHGYISSRLSSALSGFALEHRLGIVVDSSTGFRMKSGDCLSPDVSFVARERLRGRKEIPSEFFPGAPDLAVEVLSPGESRKKLGQKLALYFAHGTRIAWVVDPQYRTVSVYHSPTEFKVLRDADQLSGETLLPGFTFRVGQLFELPDFSS